ncbi:MAG: hypothetical protein QM747_08125 [Nocardioides sp.]
MTHDLLEPLEAGFADEPGHRPVADSIASGRGALRRRRRWVTSGVLVVAAAVALGPLLLRPHGGAGGGIDPPAPTPVVTAAPTPVHLLVAPAKFVRPDTPPVLYLYGRMFKRDRDVKVLATYGEIDVSTTHPRGAAIVEIGGHTSWVAVVGDEPERLVAEKSASYNYQLFMGWSQVQFVLLSGQLALAATAPGPFEPPVSSADSPAEFADHVLIAQPGGTVTRRIRDPLANAQAVPPCHAQAVQVDRPDQDWFVVGFDCHGLSQLYSEPVGVRADTLPAWLARVKKAQDAFSS